MRRALLVLAALTWAAPVWATREVVTGFEFGQLSNQFLFTVVGSPTLVNTAGEFDERFTVPSGGSYYNERAITSSHEVSEHFELTVTAAPTLERFITDHVGATGKRQCFATLGPDRRIRLYHGTTNTECSQAQNDGTPCTDASQCTEVREGEATCAPAIFAQSPQLTLSHPHEIAITQDTSVSGKPGAVTCALYVDGILRGSQTRPQGACVGGSDAGYACDENADCSSSNCLVNTIEPTTIVRLGAPNNEASAMDVTVDDWIVDSSLDTSLVATRIADLHPNGQGALAEWTDPNSNLAAHWQGIDDTTTAPNDDTATELQASDLLTERWSLTDISLTPGENVRAQAVWSLYCAAKEQGSTNDTGKTFQIGLRSGGVSTFTANLDVAPPSWGTTYRYNPWRFLTTPTTTEGGVNAVEMEVKYTGNNGSGNRTRITDCLAELEISKPLPKVPNALSEVTGDSQKTACIFGDSRFFDQALRDELTERLTELDNLINCAQGGRRADDVLGSIQQLADGVGTNNVGCTVVKGTAAHCDFPFVEIGVNDMPPWPENGRCFQQQCSAGSTTPGAFCRVNADCPGGTCGFGPQHGLTCHLPLGRANASWLREGDYCIRGAEFAKRCGGFGTETATPGACAGSPTPSGDQCDITNPNIPSCVAGTRRDAPDCAGGVCAATAETTYVLSKLRDILTALRARTGSSKVVPILVAPYPVWDQSTYEAPLGCWGRARGQLSNQRAWVQETAEALGLNWVDLWGQFYANCPEGDPRNCLRDGVHPSNTRICTCITDADCGTNGKCLGTAERPKHCSPLCSGCDQTRINCTADNQCAAGQQCLSTFGDAVIAGAFEDCLEGKRNDFVHCERLTGLPLVTDILGQ